MTIKAQEIEAENAGIVEVSADRKFPVVEIFGPTIQGEGVDQGASCYFVRLGGCDYRCDWCDTPFAVLPELVRRANRLTAQEIVDQIKALAPGPRWVVISGGNPLLHDLTRLVHILHRNKYVVSVETQGTRKKNWLSAVDRIAVSPKPPSSGHRTDMKELMTFMRGLYATNTFFKVVVFDEGDYGYAVDLHRCMPKYQMFLSAGNDAGSTVGDPSRVDKRSEEEVVLDLVRRGRWLANRVMVDSTMNNVRVQVQNHVLYWGNSRGV